MELRLRGLREDKDLTQKEISKILNAFQVAYSYYEINIRSVPLEVLGKLADYYNVSIDYLLCRTDIPTPYPKNSKTTNRNKYNEKIAL